MAADGRMRRCSRRMRKVSKMAPSAGSAGLVKPRGGIRCLLKSSCGSVKSGDRRIRTHAGASENIGHVVKPSTIESEVKPSSANSAEEAWIYVRGCRIVRSGLRFNSQGEVYVPDSEDEEEALEVSANEPAGVDLASAIVAPGVDLARAVAADGPADVQLATAVAADGVAIVEMNPEVAARLAKKVLGEDLQPEVAALLAEVLAIDMYKAMEAMEGSSFSSLGAVFRSMSMVEDLEATEVGTFGVWLASVGFIRSMCACEAVL